jgi:hypothetical protein
MPLQKGGTTGAMIQGEMKIITEKFHELKIN